MENLEVSDAGRLTWIPKIKGVVWLCVLITNSGACWPIPPWNLITNFIFPLLYQFQNSWYRIRQFTGTQNIKDEKRSMAIIWKFLLYLTSLWSQDMLPSNDMAAYSEDHSGCYSFYFSPRLLLPGQLSIIWGSDNPPLPFSVSRKTDKALPVDFSRSRKNNWPRWTWINMSGCVQKDRALHANSP